MKKKIVIGAVVVVAGYLGATWYTGQQTQKYLTDKVAEANAQLRDELDPDVQVEMSIQDYQRHFFNSDVRYAFKVNIDGEPFEFEIQDQLYHGPFPYKAVAKGHLAPLLAYSESQLVETLDTAFLFGLAEPALPLTADSRVSYGGKWDSELHFADIVMNDIDVVRIEGVTTKLAGTKNIKDLKADVGIKRVEFVSVQEGVNFSLHDFATQITSTPNDEGVVDQQYSVSLGDMSIGYDVGIFPVMFGLVGLKVEGKDRLEGDLISGGSTTTVDSILVLKENLGQFEQTVSYERINQKALTSLAQLGSDDSMDGLAEEQELEALGAQILQAQPEFSLKPMRFSNAGGELRLDLHTALKSASADAKDRWAEYLRQFNTELVLSRGFAEHLINSNAIPPFMRDDLMRNFDLALQPWVEKGLLSFTENTYRFKADFNEDDQTLRINGANYSVQEVEALMNADHGHQTNQGVELEEQYDNIQEEDIEAVPSL